MKGSEAPLEHGPKQLNDFVDRNMLQHFNLARFLVDRTSLSGWNAR
jgi:hypothetical protein